MKKVLTGLAAAAGVLLAAGVVLSAVIFLVSGRKEYVQMRTDAKPVYNHFPELPATSDIQWCSTTSESIGPSTLRLHIFAFYNHDISSELKDMVIGERSRDIELSCVPDSVNENEKWRRIENAPMAFQAGIAETEKMYTTVYINDAGTILYMDAIGD